MNSATTTRPPGNAVAMAVEGILWQGTPSRWNYLGSLLWGALLLPVGIGLLILLGAYLRRRSLRYIVTTDKLVIRYGLFVVSSRELRICDVRSINIYRRGVSGLFGLGTIEFSSAAHDAASIFFRGVLEAEAVADAVRGVQAGRNAPPLPGSAETESTAAALLHFGGLALVPILCALVFGFRLRDRIHEAPASGAETAIEAPAAAGSLAGPTTTILPTPMLDTSSSDSLSSDSRETNHSAIAAPFSPLPVGQGTVHSSMMFARAVTASRNRAIRRYPSLAVAGSHFNSAFVSRYEQLRRDGSERLQDPNWPEKLAAECAEKVPPAFQ